MFSRAHRYLHSVFECLLSLSPHQAAQRLAEGPRVLLHALLSPGGRAPGAKRHAAPPPPTGVPYADEDVMAHPPTTSLIAHLAAS